MSNHYDPNQPRVPAGHHEGGRWTPKGYPGQPISESDADKVRDGDSPKQDAEGAAEPPASMPAFFVPPPPVPNPKTAAERAWALFERLSARNTSNSRAALIFRAAKYLVPLAAGLSLKNVTILDRDQVKNYCERLDDVQRLTDQAVSEESPKFKKGEERFFGTAVHTKVAKRVEADPDQNFTAEKSLWVPGSDRYVRYDILERHPDVKISCVYDIKTGNALLPWRRMEILMRAVSELINGAHEVIVVQVKPGQS